MNYSELCKTVAGLHGSIEVSIILSKGKLVASHLKSGGPAPDEDEFRSMISQIETIIRTTKINEDKFGEVGFIAIHYKYIDGLFFPLNDHDALIVGAIPPYDHDDLVNGILALISQRKRD
jgi:hypothetical protein